MEFGSGSGRLRLAGMLNSQIVPATATVYPEA